MPFLPLPVCPMQTLGSVAGILYSIHPVLYSSDRRFAYPGWTLSSHQSSWMVTGGGQGEKMQMEFMLEPWLQVPSRQTANSCPLTRNPAGTIVLPRKPWSSFNLPHSQIETTNYNPCTGACLSVASKIIAVCPDCDIFLLRPTFLQPIGEVHLFCSVTEFLCIVIWIYLILERLLNHPHTDVFPFGTHTHTHTFISFRIRYFSLIPYTIGADLQMQHWFQSHCGFHSIVLHLFDSLQHWTGASSVC